MAPVDAQNSAIPGAISSKIGENLSEIRPNCHVNFMLIGKAPAEKSVTVQTEGQKQTVNLVSRPVLHTAG